MKFLLAFFVACLTVGSTARESVRPLNWQPLHELKSPSFKAYYDSTSITKIDDRTRAGMFMITFNSSKKFTIENNIIAARTIVKSFIIQCDTRLTAPVLGFYFKEGIPTLTTVPVATVKYTVDASDINQSSPSSIIYRVLCGIEI